MEAGGDQARMAVRSTKAQAVVIDCYECSRFCLFVIHNVWLKSSGLL